MLHINYRILCFGLLAFLQGSAVQATLDKSRLTDPSYLSQHSEEFLNLPAEQKYESYHHIPAEGLLFLSYENHRFKNDILNTGIYLHQAIFQCDGTVQDFGYERFYPHQLTPSMIIEKFDSSKIREFRFVTFRFESENSFTAKDCQLDSRIEFAESISLSIMRHHLQIPKELLELPRLRHINFENIEDQATYLIQQGQVPVTVDNPYYSYNDQDKYLPDNLKLMLRKIIKDLSPQEKQMTKMKSPATLLFSGVLGNPSRNLELTFQYRLNDADLAFLKSLGL